MNDKAAAVQAREGNQRRQVEDLVHQRKGRKQAKDRTDRRTRKNKFFYKSHMKRERERERKIYMYSF